MYEELEKSLRLCGRMINADDNCIAYYDGSCERWPVCAYDLMKQAADAIEELQKVANKLLAKYQEEAEGMIWEYSGHIDESLDYLHEEIKTLQAQIDGKPEPPKEET